MASPFDIAQLEQLIVLATKLGYDDDVAEWTNELKQLQEKGPTHG
jgi:hypothetical protein